MKIGNVSINGKVVLAPMAGVSNPAYMKICEEMGVALVVTELLSSEAIIRGNKKTFDMLNGIDELNIPVSVQIFGSDANTMAKSAKILTDKYKSISIIDINMGCPVPKVAVKSQAGSALLKNPSKIYDIVSNVVKNVSIPVTVKIRSGWDNNSLNYLEVSKAIEKAGASAICVHPRTRSQGYSGLASWDIIKEVKQNVSIPVIGNGDIRSAKDAKKMFDETGCDLVMIGRGLMGNPWLIKEINYYLENNCELEKVKDTEKIDMCLKHFQYLLSYQKENQAVLEIRSQIAWYLKGIEGSKEVKELIFKTKDKNNIINILLDFKEKLLEKNKNI